MYRAAILVERIAGARSLADLAAERGNAAPWAETGRLLAAFHQAGLDHADLNAHNVLFDEHGAGWLIDLDRGRLRRPARLAREEPRAAAAVPAQAARRARVGTSMRFRAPAPGVRTGMGQAVDA